MQELPIPADLADHVPIASAHPRPARSIAMVGARLEGRDLSMFDRGYLRTAFDMARRGSIALTPDAPIRIVNLKYGDDFLKHPPRADMVIFSYIYFSRLSEGRRGSNDYFWQSPKAGEKSKWHRALVATGARTAFNIFAGSGDCELPTSFLSSPPFRRACRYHCPWSRLNFVQLNRD